MKAKKRPLALRKLPKQRQPLKVTTLSPQKEWARLARTYMLLTSTRLESGVIAPIGGINSWASVSLAAENIQHNSTSLIPHIGYLVFAGSHSQRHPGEMVAMGRVYPESVHCPAWLLRGVKRMGVAAGR